jgi:hypothetical protein
MELLSRRNNYRCFIKRIWYIQSDRLGFKGVTLFDFLLLQQIGMAGSPTYTADTVLNVLMVITFPIIGNVSLPTQMHTLLGKGTLFNTRFKNW